MNTLDENFDKQDELNKQIEQWNKYSDSTEEINDFIKSKLYLEIFKEDIYKDYIVNAMEQYVATRDQNYILKACAPIYARQYIQYIKDNRDNIAAELKNYYRKRN